MEAVLLQDSLLSLNDKLVWLDIWAFDQFYSKIEKSRYSTGKLVDLEELKDQFDRLLDYYRGPFLDSDEQNPCLVMAREYFRSRFVKAVELLVSDISEVNTINTAGAFYERAIDRDPGAEEIYRNYIIRLLSIGDKKRALDIYERCLEALSRTPQRAPSPELQKLYEQLQADLKSSGIGH